MSTAPADRTTHPTTTGNRHTLDHDQRHAARPDGIAPRLLPGTGPKQPKLPVSFTAKRGCDRIRARLYADQRLKGLVLAVLLALSEFVDVRRKAWPKQTTLAEMVHATRENVGRALATAAQEYGVVAKDRNRRGGGCQYTFLDSWIRWFLIPGEASENETFRSDVSSLLEVTIRHFSGEPVQGTLLDPIAAADPSRASAADRRQQQQHQTRIEGLFGAIAARCRELGYDYNEQDERRRLREGEIDIDCLQRQADDLEADMRERRLLRAHGPR